MKKFPNFVPRYSPKTFVPPLERGPGYGLGTFDMPTLEKNTFEQTLGMLKKLYIVAIKTNYSYSE